MKNQVISKTVIAVTVVTVAIAAGMYFFPKMDGSRNTALKTYTNDVYGVTFDYPTRYDLTETNMGETVEESRNIVILIDKGTKIPENGEGPTAITVEMYDGSVVADPKENPMKSWILNATSSNWKQSNQDEPGETRIGEKDALLYTWDGLYQGTSVVTEHNGNIIVFTVTYDGDTDLRKREDFTKLVESVRFESATSSTATTTKS